MGNSNSVQDQNQSQSQSQSETQLKSQSETQSLPQLQPQPQSQSNPDPTSQLHPKSQSTTEDQKAKVDSLVFSELVSINTKNDIEDEYWTLIKEKLASPTPIVVKVQKKPNSPRPEKTEDQIYSQLVQAYVKNKNTVPISKLESVTNNIEKLHKRGQIAQMERFYKKPYASTRSRNRSRKRRRTNKHIKQNRGDRQITNYRNRQRQRLSISEN